MRIFEAKRRFGSSFPRRCRGCRRVGLADFESSGYAIVNKTNGVHPELTDKSLRMMKKAPIECRAPAGATA
jgi:hypothetical protein